MEKNQEKLNKLQQKSNTNLQKFINSAFDMVSEAKDINDRIIEIQEAMKAGEEEKEEKEKKLNKKYV